MEPVTSVRDDLQEAIVNEYIASNALRSTLVLSTGFGKSKVAIDIIKKLNPEKVLILVNSTILRDYSWEAEFKTFGAEDIYNTKVEMQTYQAAYKWKSENKNLSNYLVIADEVDFAGDTNELSKFFYEYPMTAVLGLTGFVTELKQLWFSENLPISTTFTANDAQNLGILNNINFVFVKYDLSTARDIKVEYKKDGAIKSFMQSENGMYDHLNKQVFKLIAEKDKFNDAFLLGQLTKTEYDAKIKSLEYNITRAVAERADLLLTSSSSRTLTSKLITYLTAQQPSDKIIVFSKRTSQSILICGEENCYNGTIDKKEANNRFEEFQSGDRKLLAVCDKVNRGANIPNLKIAIFESFYGSDTDAVQKLGRLMRLEASEKATAYVLLPYYMRKEVNDTFTVQETQQVEWARSMLKSTKVKSHTTWDYCVVKHVKKK